MAQSSSSAASTSGTGTGRSIWTHTKSGSKAGFDKLWKWADKLGAPVNRLSNKLGAEAFWPTTMDKESDKAARILRSFCKDGFYQEEAIPTVDGPQAKQRVLKKIPAEVIRDAKGIAIFTTMRTGLWVSGAGGSGVIVARLPDGSWSPPSGLMLHTAGLGFLVGVDIYDCVMVINTYEALAGFSKLRCTVGGELSAVAGPVGMGGVIDSEVHKRQAPVFTYLKSRGFYAGIQIDGTILIERTDENARFYGEQIGVADILAGKVRHPPYETRTLMQTIKAAQGDTDVDESALPTEAPPSDFDIIDNKVFGVPDRDDPDPYGVLALEREGMQVREAGSQQKPSFENFLFHPSPTSPLFNTFNRDSIDGRTMVSRRSSWRASILSSTAATEKSTQTVDMCTQTDFDGTPATSPALSEPPTTRLAGIQEAPLKTEMLKPPSVHSMESHPASETTVQGVNILVNDVPIQTELSEVAIVQEAREERVVAVAPAPAPIPTPAPPMTDVELSEHIAPHEAHDAHEVSEADDEDDEDLEDDEDDEPTVEIVEPVVMTVQRTSPQLKATKIRTVTVAKRPAAPPLPERNPIRERKTSPMSAAGSPKLTEQPSPAAPTDIVESRPVSPLENTEASSDVLEPEQPRGRTSPSVADAISELRMLHRRSSSVSTYRERSSGRRSNSEASVSSMEQLTGFERHLAAKSKASNDDDDDAAFHSATGTPAIERENPIEGIASH